MFASSVVGFPDRRRVVGQEGIAVIAVVFRHCRVLWKGVPGIRNLVINYRNLKKPSQEVSHYQSRFANSRKKRQKSDK
jgi:hypothetical protein